ncbi:MAG: hypothetical protein Q6373_013560 [Candidatus Sigynarchaeota archaeon]
MVPTDLEVGWKNGDATMNKYALKGVLLDANPPARVTPLKGQVFRAISFPGFGTSMYDRIGIDFGLGIMELPRRNPPAIVKLQVWNVNEQRNVMLDWRHFLKGSMFGIITANQTGSGDLARLEAMLGDCIDACPGMNIGIVMQQGDGETTWPAGMAAIESCQAIIGRKFNVFATIDEDLDTMVLKLVEQVLDGARAIHVLSIRDTADLAHVPSIQDPSFNYHAPVSNNLLRFLEQQEIRIDGGHAILETKDHVCRIDLANASLHVAPKQCASCNSAFTRVCVVLDSEIKRGYSSESLGFTTPDLFVLSMIFAIQNGELPPSVSRQFPRVKSFTRQR